MVLLLIRNYLFYVDVNFRIEKLFTVMTMANHQHVTTQCLHQQATVNVTRMLCGACWEVVLGGGEWWLLVGVGPPRLREMVKAMENPNVRLDGA